MLISNQAFEAINSNRIYDPDLRAKIFEYLNSIFSVIPVNTQSKVPSISNWSEYCTIKSSFNEYDFIDKNAGIACGPASGVLVVDIDNEELFKKHLGTDKYNALLSIDTFKVLSGKNGPHIYFKYPDDGKEYGNRSRKVKIDNQNITIFDIRGIGGQVLAPGSIHPETGRAYTIMNNAYLQDAPRWILDFAEKGILHNTSVNLSDENYSRQFEFIYDDNFDINSLELTDEIKDLIQVNFPVGTRSENEMRVIRKLVIAGVEEENIFNIFENYSIGKKHRERGNSRFEQLKKQIEKAKKYTGFREPRLMSMGEVLSSEKEFSFLIDNFWPLNENMILYGRGGVGKSLFALNLALEIASPSLDGFLGKYKVNQTGNVLIFQSENSIASYKNKFKLNDRLGACGLLNGYEIYFAPTGNDIMTSGNILNKLFYDYVLRMINQAKPRLVIFDPLVSFHDEDENSNVGMRKVLDKFTELAQDYETNILIVHHDGKGKGQSEYSGGRGASAIGDWARNIIELSKKDAKSQIFEMKQLKSSNFEGFGQESIRRNEDLTYAATNPKINTSANTNIVIKALRTFGGQTTTQSILAEKIATMYKAEYGEAISHNTAVNRINESLTSGLIKSQKDGRNKIILMNH